MMGSINAATLDEQEEALVALLQDFDGGFGHFFQRWICGVVPIKVVGHVAGIEQTCNRQISLVDPETSSKAFKTEPDYFAYPVNNPTVRYRLKVPACSKRTSRSYPSCHFAILRLGSFCLIGTRCLLLHLLLPWGGIRHDHHLK